MVNQVKTSMEVEVINQGLDKQEVSSSGFLSDLLNRILRRFFFRFIRIMSPKLEVITEEIVRSFKSVCKVSGTYIIDQQHSGKERTWSSPPNNLLIGIPSWFFPFVFIFSRKMASILEEAKNMDQELVSAHAPGLCQRRDEKEKSWPSHLNNLPRWIPSCFFPFVFIFSLKIHSMLEVAETMEQKLLIYNAPKLYQGNDDKERLWSRPPNNFPSGIPSWFFPFIIILSSKIESILKVAKITEQELTVSHDPDLHQGHNEKRRSWSSMMKTIPSCLFPFIFVFFRKLELILEEEEKQRPWSDLPDLLLCEIFSRLLPRDRVVFQSICRSWNSIGVMVTQGAELPKHLKSIKYPYLIFSNNRVFDLISENCHLMSGSDISGLRALSGSSYGNFHYMDFLQKEGAVIRVAKDGWLLMSVDYYDIFFYNPLTREKVQLPFLQKYTMSMYFSSPPTSKDWFVIVIALNTSNDIVLYTTKSGDNSWNRCKFLMKENPLFLSLCNAVVFEGMYYFLGEDAKLLIHDPITKQFYYHKAPESIQLYASGGDQYMLVTDDGKLLVVFEGCDGSSIRVCQWNPLKVIWETVESLGDKVLFVSRSQSLCIKAIIKGTENRIYFPRLVGSHCVFYSLTTKKLHTSTFSMDTSYDNFLGIKEYKDATWMI